MTRAIGAVGSTHETPIVRCAAAAPKSRHDVRRWTPRADADSIVTAASGRWTDEGSDEVCAASATQAIRCRMAMLHRHRVGRGTGRFQRRIVRRLAAQT
jgi:hypothetical protein